MIDHEISGRYKINSQLGSGGMGIVYHAHDLKLRRDVALKVIAPHLVEDEEARARFLREAQALAGLSHPNIVTVFDLSEETETGMVFIVMELLNGKPLRKHITNPARPPFYDMAIQVCRALEHAHGNGVLHRDIKPENIFVCNDGTVKLMDFGLARLVDGATVNSSTVVTGTIAYMSPEQLRGGALDPRADLYGLGVLFYEYLCGFTPFSSDSPGTMLLKHLTEPAPSLRTRVPAVSADLDALILHLLAKEPEGRYPSAMVLRDSLERIRARGATTSPAIAAPTSAGPAMPATLIPLCGPAVTTVAMPARAPLLAPNRARSRHSAPPAFSGAAGIPPELRSAALFCVVLLGALLAYAIGESFHYMSARPPDPPKKTTAVSKSAKRKAARAAAERSRHFHRQGTAGHSELAEKPTPPQDKNAATPANDPPNVEAAPADPQPDENPTDDKSKAPDSDNGGV